MNQASSKPVRDVRLGPADVVVEKAANGTRYVRSPHSLGEYPDTMTERLDRGAEQAPVEELYEPSARPIVIDRQ